MKKISNNVLLFSLLALFMVFIGGGFAQEIQPSFSPTPINMIGEIELDESLMICKDAEGLPRACEDKDLLSFLVASLGGLKGLGALGIAFIISKLLLMFLLSPLFSTMFPSLLKGNVKLTIAFGLNLIVGILALMVPPVSLSFFAAITHSSVLALASVFANQAYKQFFTQEGKA